MIIKYYGFGKKYIGEELLTEETVLPNKDICGYEIFDDQGELKRACFQGKSFQILELLDKDSPAMNLFQEKTQAHFRDLADQIYKEEGFDKFIINVRGNDTSFQPLIPCEETALIRTKEDLKEVFLKTQEQFFKNDQKIKM